ncbi:DNA pilot protein [Microvirus sp.]|nr:DNA pilot protein [Microvirus sp.]
MAIGAFISAVASLASRAINQNESDRVRREQNIFNKYEAQRAREWNQQMDSTKYQRTVADMQAAGVNPALAMQGGVTTQASSNATASAANVGPAQVDLSQVAQLAMQSKQLQIQDKLANAEVRLKNADAELKEKDANVRDDYNNLMMEGMKISNNLNESQIDQIRANVGKIGEEVELLKKQAATEEERKLLTIAETSLRKAMERKTDQEIKNMVSLLPFQQSLMSAQTEQAKANAAAQFVHAAYEQGLIDSGYIYELTQNLYSSSLLNHSKWTAQEIENDLKTGKFITINDLEGPAVPRFIKTVTQLGYLFENIAKIKSAFK